MINGIGVLGWGVGGIEAEAAMLGEASYFPVPEVIGVRLLGKLPKIVNSDGFGSKGHANLAAGKCCWQICRILWIWFIKSKFGRPGNSG